MTSFKQMRRDGVIKHADQRRIRYEDIHIEPGFNAEGRHDPADPENISLLAHIKAGGMFPALEVRPRDEGGVWIVEGHRRYVEIGNALRDGCTLFLDKDGILWVDIVQFEGNDIDRHVRVVTSQSNMKLTPLQLGLRYKTLRGFKKTPDEIAASVHRTRQHVDQMLILADANHDVQEAVAAGDISATEAVKLQRQHGESTGSVIQKAKGDAKGGKVTAKGLKPWTPPAKVVAPVVDAVSSLLDSLDNTDRQRIEKSTVDNDVFVSVSARELLDVFKAYNGIGEARHAAANKAMAKQAKAAQMDLAGSDGE